MMQPRSFATMLALSVLAISCGGSLGRGRGHICDGSTSMRLGMARLANPSSVPAGEQVMLDNGVAFLYVDGTCRYWTTAGDYWAAPHSGVLTQRQASQLETDVHYADWATGDWRNGNVRDGAIDIFYDTSVKFSCTKFSVCEGSSAPALVQGLSSRFGALVSPLWNAGAVVDDSSVRITVVRLEAGQYDKVPHIPWPLAVPVKSISVDFDTAQSQGYGHGVLFQGSDAAQLRALRSVYQAGNYHPLGVLGLPIVEAGQTYLLFLRDALTIEDSRGLVRPSF